MSSKAHQTDYVKLVSNETVTGLFVTISWPLCIEYSLDKQVKNVSSLFLLAVKGLQKNTKKW